jgi:hypothetical protein
MVTMDGGRRLIVFQYKRDSAETVDGRRTAVVKRTAGFLVVGFEMCHFRFCPLLVLVHCK